MQFAKLFERDGVQILVQKMAGETPEAPGVIVINTTVDETTMAELVFGFPTIEARDAAFEITNEDQVFDFRQKIPGVAK